MTTKLTLSINKKTVERAKRISLRRGKSISKMVEEYLDTIAEKEEERESVVKKWSGVLKDKLPADAKWKKIKAQHLTQKHGL